MYEIMKVNGDVTGTLPTSGKWCSHKQRCGAQLLDQAQPDPGEYFLSPMRVPTRRTVTPRPGWDPEKRDSTLTHRLQSNIPGPEFPTRKPAAFFGPGWRHALRETGAGGGGSGVAQVVGVCWDI